MSAEIGLAAVGLAFLAALYAIFACVYGERTYQGRLVLSGRNAALLTFPLLLIAVCALWTALLSGDYQISYVWSVSNPQTPIFYRITALWGSQQGSLLFWSLLMSGFSAVAIWLNWRSERRLMPYATAVMMATLAFFIGLLLFFENPFARYWLDSAQQVIQSTLIPANALTPDAGQLAATAKGLNPLLRHFGMIIHPPMLYLGFTGFVVPFAFALAALASGDLSPNWIKATRRWTLIAWLFLSLGLILGGRWAYDVLGWGGYWGWDPVENAAFLPWLIGTAFLHSVMIQQKRGMLKVWNMVLVLLTFSAVLFGTFATRSGVIESVHSFARSQIGFPMLTFWATMTIIGLGLLVWRWQRGELRDEHAFAGLLSRETLFVLNNVIFVALALVIFWGSFGAPILSELVLHTEITLGKEYFMQVTPPLFLAMYLLMGIAPLSAWSATTIARLGNALFVPALLTLITVAGIVFTSPTTLVSLIGYAAAFLAGYVALWETYRGIRARRGGKRESWAAAIQALFRRNPQRYGGYLVHLGITIIGIGVIGSTLFQLETRQTLRQGETVQISPEYQIRFDALERGISADGREIDTATLTLLQDSKIVTQITPRIDNFPGQAMTISGAYSTLEKDVYVLLTGADATGQTATFKIYINPLVNLVWWGGVILILGTLLAAWPHDAVPERARQTASKIAKAAA